MFAGSLQFIEVVSQPSKSPTYDSVHGHCQFRLDDIGFNTSLSVCLPTKHRPAEAGATVSPAHRKQKKAELNKAAKKYKRIEAAATVQAAGPRPNVAVSVQGLIYQM